MSTDCLFRVRANQPYNTVTTPQLRTCKADDTLPVVKQVLEVDDICAFKHTTTKWKIGRILQFAHYLERTKMSRQYCGTMISLSDKSQKFGALSWYTPTTEAKDCLKFSSELYQEQHLFISVTSYICTLSHRCFDKIEKIDEHDHTHSSVCQQRPDFLKLDLARAKHITLTESTLTFINTQILSTKSKDVVTIGDADKDQTSSTNTEEHWIEYGGVSLTRKHLQMIMNGSELCDKHVNAFQNLLKSKYPNIGGLQNTLFQERTPLELKEEVSLQIIHSQKSHWAAIQICNDDIFLSHIDH